VRELEGKRQFQTLRSKWEYNIKVNIQEVEFEEVGWCNFARNRDKMRAVKNTVMNIWVR
jgi:hypothetical protein